jgi:ribonuclease III
MSDIHAFAEIIGIQFHDYSLLLRALTHSSYVNENQAVTLEDNERLEFLGDAVIDFVVAAYLYHHFPEMQEGELTSLRAALVRSETLAQFARQLQIGDYLQLGLGEAEHGGRERMPILCATFEAVVGAIYLDQGLPTVEAWLPPLIAPALKEILAESLHKDAKSEFQMWAQAQFNITPHYRMATAAGPDHDKIFTVEVRVGDTVWGEGEGRSKQAAAQAAATEAIDRAELWELSQARYDDEE